MYTNFSEKTKLPQQHRTLPHTYANYTTVCVCVCARWNNTVFVHLRLEKESTIKKKINEVTMFTLCERENN